MKRIAVLILLLLFGMAGSGRAGVVKEGGEFLINTYTTYAQRNPDIAGVVTSGATLALSENLSRGRILCARLLRWLAPRLSLASGLDPEFLSRDAAVVRAYLEDPLVHQRITTSLACEMLSAMRRTASAAAQVRVPILLLHGEEDRLCPVAGSRDFFDRLKVSSRRIRTYPGLRHEIFNEPERVTVLNDLIDWIRNIEPGPETLEV